MTPVALFVVGPPGAGKTTLVRQLLSEKQRLVTKPKWTISRPLDSASSFHASQWVCAAGHYTGQPFDGADTVPYNGVDAALNYWERELLETYPLTIFDGDRFSNAGVLKRVRESGALTLCVLIRPAQDVLEARLQERQAQTGKVQNESWARGRVTKAENFSNLFSGRARFVLRAPWSSALLAATVQSWIAARRAAANETADLSEAKLPGAGG